MRRGRSCDHSHGRGKKGRACDKKDENGRVLIACRGARRELEVNGRREGVYRGERAEVKGNHGVYYITTLSETI